jgi:hypothetical protein
LHKQQDEGGQKKTGRLSVYASGFVEFTNGDIHNQKRPVVYPTGKPMILHLLRCQGFAVGDYSFTLGRLEAAASSTFATSG